MSIVDTRRPEDRRAGRGASLFDPLALRQVTLPNRIGVSPMCQYSARNGRINDWHLVHLGSRAVGGAGLVIMEDTAVSPQGRISPGDAGLWDDGQVEPLSRLTRFIQGQGAVPGIQLGHAGRKASSTLPWEGGRPRSEGRHLTDEEGAWETIAPSPLAFGDDRPRVPRAMTEADIADVIAAFRDAARRALDAGFAYLMIHASHGYLFQQFYSPLTNHRTDRYGGSFDNRVRLLMETVAAVREVWPERLPLGVRLAARDYAEGGWDIDEAEALARQLAAAGVDHLDNMAFGANVPEGKPPFGPAFLVPDAARLKRASGLAVSVSALSDPVAGTAPRFLEQQLGEGGLDLVLLGRQMLVDPYWPVRAAQRLGLDWAERLPTPYAHWLQRPD